MYTYYMLSKHQMRKDCDWASTVHAQPSGRWVWAKQRLERSWAWNSDIVFVRRDCVMKMNNFGRSYLDRVLADVFIEILWGTSAVSVQSSFPGSKVRQRSLEIATSDVPGLNAFYIILLYICSNLA